MKKSIKVWVAVQDGEIATEFGGPVTFYSKNHAMDEYNWPAKELVRATLTLDEPKPKKNRCPNCGGHGEIGCQNEYHTCSKCRGTGKIKAEPKKRGKKR